MAIQKWPGAWHLPAGPWAPWCSLKGSLQFTRSIPSWVKACGQAVGPQKGGNGECLLHLEDNMTRVMPKAPWAILKVTFPSSVLHLALDELKREQWKKSFLAGSLGSMLSCSPVRARNYSHTQGGSCTCCSLGQGHLPDLTLEGPICGTQLESRCLYSLLRHRPPAWAPITPWV